MRLSAGVVSLFSLALIAVSNAGLAAGSRLSTPAPSAPIVIPNDDTTIRITFETLTVTVLEGGTATLNVLRSGNLTATAVVAYLVKDEKGVTQANGSVSFGTGETAKPLSILVPTDGIYTGDRTWSVVLSSTQQGISLFSSTASVLIVEDDLPVKIQFDTFSVIAREGAGTVSIGVTRSGDVNTPVTINYIVGDDYYSNSASHGGGAIAFAAGQTHATIPITIPNDNVYTPDRSWTVRLTTNAPSVRFLDSSGSVIPSYYYYYASLTIKDDDPPINITFESFNMRVSESAGSVAVRVLRSGDVSSPVTISYVIGNYAGDASRGAGALAFVGGQTAASVPVSIPNDAIYTGDRFLTVTLLASSPGIQFIDRYGAAGAAGGWLAAAVVIVDADPIPILSVDNISVVEGNSGTTNATFTISLSAPLLSGTQISYETIDGTAKAGLDYLPANGQLYFAPGETTKTVTIKVIGDTEAEANETFGLQLEQYCYYCYGLTPRIGSPGYATIINDDLGVGPRSQTLSVGQTGEYIIQLGLGAATAQTIGISASPEGVVSLPSALEVPAGATSATFAVKALARGDTTFTLTMPAALGAGTLTAAARVLATANLILDPVSLSLVAGSSATVNASIDPPAAEPIVVSVWPTDATLLGLPATLVIPAGGRASFKVTALKKGEGGIVATLPPQFGGTAYNLSVDVAAPSTDPLLTVANPAGGTTAGGTPVTLAGANLSADCSVAFGGIPAAGSFVDASTITASTPAHVAGPVSVTLTCGTKVFTLPSAFTYFDSAPALLNISPSFGGTGGGTLVRLAGTNFRSGCWAFFDGTPAKGVKLLNAGTLIGTTPRHALGSVDVSVRCGPHSATLPKGFSFSTTEEPSPVVTSVDPLAGAAGQSVTIGGVRFRANDVVTFGSGPATILTISPETIVVRIPELPLGKVAITVTDDTGHASTTGPIFTILEADRPRITAITPASVAPGAEVTIEGKGFRPGYTIAFGGKTASYISLETTRVVVRLDRNLGAGTYPAEILNASGQTSSFGPSLTVLDRGMAIAGVSPRCGTTDGGVDVTLAGSGFATGATVTFNGIPASNVTFVDAQTLNATAPPNATGLARIVVTNPNGDSATISDAFRYDAPADPDGGCAAGSKRRAAR